MLGLTLPQIISLVFFIGIAIVLFRYRQQVQKFMLEVAAELKKVSWPTRQELWDSSLIVIFSSFLLGVFIASADFALSQMIKVVIK